MTTDAATTPSPRPRLFRKLVVIMLVVILAVFAVGALWDFGYARQLNDLQAAVMKEVPIADLQRGDPLAIASASTQLEGGPPERAAGMQQFERIHPPFWKEGVQQQLLTSLRHWQELDNQVLFARLGANTDEVMQKFIEPNLDEILRQSEGAFGMAPAKGDPRQFTREYCRDFVSEAFARLPDYQRARAESELLYKHARRIYFLF